MQGRGGGRGDKAREGRGGGWVSAVLQLGYCDVAGPHEICEHALICIHHLKVCARAEVSAPVYGNSTRQPALAQATV
jgi:hypothetical protein